MKYVFEVKAGHGWSGDESFGFFSSEEGAKAWIEQSDMHPEDKAELFVVPHVLDGGVK